MVIFMKLFDEMEKCFPETEKQWDQMIEALGDMYLTPSVLMMVETLLVEWVMKRYLRPAGELNVLFVQAGIEEEAQMAELIVKWMHYARHSVGKPYVSRTDIFPAQE